VNDVIPSLYDTPLKPAWRGVTVFWAATAGEWQVIYPNQE